MYNVMCDCGKEKQVLGSSLRYNATRSCNKCKFLTGSHGMHKSREYRIWCGMKSRCSNKNDPNFKKYGAKGISVCESWKNSFASFYQDMGQSNGLSIDRIDNNGNYTLENCRWADPKTQAQNRNNNLCLNYNGINMCASSWCEYLNMPSSTFFNRLKRGWSIEKIIKTPIRKLKDKKK